MQVRIPMDSLPPEFFRDLAGKTAAEVKQVQPARLEPIEVVNVWKSRAQASREQQAQQAEHKAKTDAVTAAKEKERLQSQDRAIREQERLQRWQDRQQARLEKAQDRAMQGDGKRERFDKRMEGVRKQSLMALQMALGAKSANWLGDAAYNYIGQPIAGMVENGALTAARLAQGNWGGAFDSGVRALGNTAQTALSVAPEMYGVGKLAPWAARGLGRMGSWAERGLSRFASPATNWMGRLNRFPPWAAKSPWRSYPTVIGGSMLASGPSEFGNDWHRYASPAAGQWADSMMKSQSVKLAIAPSENSGSTNALPVAVKDMACPLFVTPVRVGEPVTVA